MVRRNPPSDRSKVKVASFRISEGEWFDFSEEADRQNVTATDVIKGAIRNFMAGDFVLPEPIEPTPELSTSQIGSMADVERIVSTLVDTAMGRLSILGIDRVTEIARSEVELATAPMFDDLLNLQSQLAEVKNDCDLTTEGIQRLIDNAIAKISTTVSAAIETNPKASKSASSTDWMSISAFAQEHGLDIARGTPAAAVRAVLVEKGLDSDWQYDAKNARFKPIEVSASQAIEYLDSAAENADTP
jgi:hypothetical protein